MRLPKKRCLTPILQFFVYGANQANLLGNDLAGAAIGMRGYMLKDAYYDVFVSRPLAKPEGFVTSETAGGFSLNYQF